MNNVEPKPAVSAADRTAKPSRRRSARKWLLRIVLGAITLAVVTYATLPYWLPTGWLARRFEAQLTTDLNRQVYIGAIRVGWWHGISIENITIVDRNGRPDELLARIGRINCGFTPLTTLRTGRVDHLEIIDPEIWLGFDEQGRLISLADLATHSAKQGGFPTWEYRVRRASCHLRMPELLQTFRIDDLTCRIDKPAGILSISGRTAIPRDDPGHAPDGKRMAKLLVEGKIVTPKLRKETTLRGQGRIEWEGLAITDLPLLVAMHFPIEQLDGSSNGKLAFSVQPDLRIEHDLSMVFHGVRILRRGTTKPAQVPDASFACKGWWDPATDRLALNEFDYETPAVRLRGSGNAETPALAVDPAGEVPLAVRLTSRVKDWVALCREFPDVDRWTRSSMVRVEGGADLSLDFVRRRDEDHLVASIEGRRLSCGLGPPAAEFLCGDPDIDKRLSLDIRYDAATGKYTQKEVSFSIGGMTLACRGEMTVPPSEVRDGWEWLTTVFPTLRCELAARIDDLGEIARLLPASRKQAAFVRGKGRAEVRFSITPKEDQSRLELAMNVPADAEIDLGPGVLVKPAGRPMSFSAGFGIPHRFAGQLDRLVLDLAYGEAGVHLAPEGARAEVRAAFEGDASRAQPRDEFPGGASSRIASAAPREVDGQGQATAVLDASWSIPLKVKGIERVAGLVPGLPAALSKAGLELNGNAELAVNGRLIRGADHWLARNELMIKTGDLAVRWPEVLDKPPDVPIDLVLAHQCQSIGGRCEQSLHASVRQPAGEVTGSLVFSEGRREDCSDDFEAAAVRVNLGDLDRFLAVAPALREVLARAKPTGGAAMEFRSLLAEGRASAEMTLDATPAGFVVPSESPLVKAPRTPARLRLAWKTAEDPYDTAGSRWRVTGGLAEMGGLSVADVSGLIVLEPGETPLPLLNWARRAVRQKRLPSRLRAAVLQVNGQLDLDDPMWREHPLLKGWCGKVDPSGRAEWDLEAGLDEDVLSLRGEIDAREVGWTCDIGSRAVPAFSKTKGTPAGVLFDVAAVSSRESQRTDIEARNIEFALDGNTLNASGLLRVRDGDRGEWRPKDFILDASFRLTNPSGIRNALAGCRFEVLEGEAFGQVAVRGTPKQVDVPLAEIGFDGLLVGAGSDPVGLDGRIVLNEGRIVLNEGRIVLNEGRIRLDQLTCSWGRSRGTVAGLIHVEDDQPRKRARLGMVVQEFNQTELASLFEKLPLEPPTNSQPEGGSSKVKRAIIERLRNLDLDLDLRVDRGTAILPLEVQVEADAAVNRMTVKDGYVHMNFGAVVDGGSVTGSFMTDLARTEPTIYLNYTASRIQPGPLVDKYLTLTFPGMKAAGPLTIVDETYQKLSPAPGEPNYEVGEGELMIEGGTVAGRAAPLWMTSVFPGLNLATFDFSYMHSWFKKFDDGRIRHQMIFQGRFYNVYMVGESNAQGFMSYDVGIDFLADFDSRYWAESGQGRVPLFTKSGRMTPEGTLANEEVVYVPRKFIQSLLVANNPLVTAYHAVRKRVRGER